MPTVEQLKAQVQVHNKKELHSTVAKESWSGQ
jgi:hypothetical protein